MTLDENNAGALHFLDRSEIELSLPNKRCFVEGTSGFMKAPTAAYKAAKEVVQEAMRRDDIYKPFAWAVYQTWKWVDINETPRKKK